MSNSSYENIYSPGTNDQQIVLARNQFQNEITAFAGWMRQEQQAVDQKNQAVEAERMRVQEQEASQWQETIGIRTQLATLNHETAVVKREGQLLESRDRELLLKEDPRRRNRTTSAAYIEDFFATLSPRAVVENLTNSSRRMRQHAMDNISACIGGNQNSPATFSRFTPQDIAADLLPKLHHLVSSSVRPVESEVQFAEGVVSAPPMAKALALGGQCLLLTRYLVGGNESASRLAICCLRRMVGMETSVVKHAYEAMALAIPQLPIPKSPEQPLHPAIDFVKEVVPKIIEDCFNNGLWLAVAPLVSHHITSIRQIVLRKVVLLARQSDRNQLGIVEGRVLGLLDPYYQSSSPPPDMIEFFVDLLPLVADKLCHRPAAIQWLLKRLSDPNTKINATVLDAFRTCLVNHDTMAFQVFVTAELLRKLDEPPIQQSFAITTLICQALPVLAIAHARAKASEGIVRFLNHSDPAVATACLSACVWIVKSTLDDRTHFLSVVSKLDITKESTLKLFEHAMPVFCKDWAASGDFRMIVRHIQHPEKRIRLPAQHVWREIVYNSPAARSKIAHDGLLDVIFELCSSQYEDAVVLGAKCCPPMAAEITKAGVASSQKLVALLGHPNTLLRQAALQGIQFASESSDGNCDVLLKAGTFKALHLFFDAYPKDPLEHANKILARLAPFLNMSRTACDGLLHLLESSSQTVRDTARNALLTMSNTNLGNRDILRAVVLDHLALPTEPLIEFCVKAIQDWVGPDLVQLDDFPKFFSLVEHSDRRIQTAALIALKQKLPNADYQRSLEKANIIFALRSLSNSDNPEALNFVAVALQVLALSLARNGHTNNIIDFLVHNEPKVRDGAASAIEVISSGDVRDRKQLLEEDIIERLVDHEEHLEHAQTDLLASIVPMLALDYLEAGRTGVFFGLVDHPQQRICTAASKSVVIIASGTAEQKACLRDALLPRLEQASPLLREVAANCLSQSLAYDLVTDGDFVQVFRIFLCEDARVREPMVFQLQAYIRQADETARRRLVDARILPAILQAYTPAKDDLLDFISCCLLPMLGPSFTQDDGGAALFPLLAHDEHRLRVSAVQALKNAVDSRHGNMENMAKASIVGTLHSFTTSDDLIRKLWCRILPKAAPYLLNRDEVEILFESLKDAREDVREAASQAISVMAKTSEASRSTMLPTLLHNLDNPPPALIPSIAQVISLSGITFVSNSKESELLHLILNGKAVSMSTAAVEATTQLLAKGSSFEHEQLVKTTPDVLTVALRFHDRQSQRLYSLKLLQSIVMHLSYILFLDEGLAREMFSLFDDPDTGLSNALYQTWSSDPRVTESEIFPELLPLLFDDSRLRNPSVPALLQQLAPSMVAQLASRRRFDILVKALMMNDANVVRSFLQEISAVIENSNEDEKGWIVAEPSFILAVGKCLKGHDATMLRDSSTIVRLLSTGSASRSGRIMNEGIGRYLSWVAVNGEKGAQQASLYALYSLFRAAPDHAERLVRDSLPALCDILEQEDLFLGVYMEALRLLAEIVQQPPHFVTLQSGIVVYLVRWISPQYSVTDARCRKHVFDICQLIAEHSDPGRQALIDAGILPELSLLARSQVAVEVISSCKVLKALVHTGTFGQDIIFAGLKTSMEHITSLFRKSTLQTKEEKHLAQAAAKEVLETLNLSKQHAIKLLVKTQASQLLQRPTDPGARLLDSPQHILVDEGGVIQPELHPCQSLLHSQRSTSGSLAIPGFDALDGGRVQIGQSATRRLYHSQLLGKPAKPTTLQPQSVHLPAIQEDPKIPDSPQHATIIGEEELDYIGPHISQQTGHLHWSTCSHGRSPEPIRMLSPLDEDHLTDTSLSVDLTTSGTTSSRLMTSLSSNVRRLTVGQDRGQDLPPLAAEEVVLTTRQMSTTTPFLAEPPESYKPMASMSASHHHQLPDDHSPALIQLQSLKEPLDEGHLTDMSSSAVLNTSQAAPPSYRTNASVSGSVRRPINRDHAQGLLPATTEELDLDTAEPRRSYRQMTSNVAWK